MKWVKPEIKHLELTKWKWLVSYPENLKLGHKVDIGAFTYIMARFGVVIEDFVQIGSHVSIYSLSTIDDKKGKVIIKRNARVGSHSIIMPGVEIGENSVIGAQSFVPAYTKISKNEVWAGVPVRKLKKF